MSKGGAGRVSDAMRSLIEARGGVVLADTHVKRVIVREGAAVGVETSGGRSYSASRAVVANLSPHSLFGPLVEPEALPSSFLSRIRAFRYGVGTFVVYLALSKPLEWCAGGDLSRFNTVHVNGSVEQMAAACGQALAGLLPARPLLIVNQVSATDPSRAAGGGCVARIHSRPFPARIIGDTVGTIAGAGWDEAKDAVADRLLDQLAEHAPNVRENLLARHVASPLDLERDNPNWVGGDCGSGSNHLDQSYMLRPVRGWTRYEMPIRRLYMVGSSTWPSGGTHGMSGYLLAKRLSS